MPGARVVLVPMLEGGSAGWGVAITYTSRKGGGGAGGGTRTTTGPIFHESCSETRRYVVTSYVTVLTRGDVAAVRVADGAPIPTESNSTLPDGLRAAAIELPGYRIAGKPFATGYPWSPCPGVTALAADGKPIDEQGRTGVPLEVQLPRRHWEASARPASGVCALTAPRLPSETRVLEGTVAVRVRPLPELLSHAFIACAETAYWYQDEHQLPAAVLLNAAHPGAEPPGLPGMKPLASHPGIFETPPDRFARRIGGAWLVVQEEDNIGPSIPIELLEHLHATVHVP
jgi:hypothetical protein